MENIRIVGHELVAKHLKYVDLIPATRKALEEYSLNRSQQPLRTVIPVEKWNGTLLSMPSYSTSQNALATKIVTMYGGNAKLGIPSHQGCIMLFDSTNGSLLCVLDCELITAMRTAAASVVATQAILTCQPKILGVLGSGVQARSHIRALCEVYKFDEIRVWSRNPENVGRLCSELQYLNVMPKTSAEEAVRGSDIVVTVTNSTSPVLRGEWLKKGCHINCVGACLPSWREVDDDCMKKCVVYADSRESAEKESGDVIMSKVEVYAEIGEVLLREKPLKEARFTFFKSLGLPLEDAVAAKLAWEKLNGR